jgi:diaminohydroxyphosphoribosylaminopyrimidine deaminase/5-amino-6-(5-phosphoribosylamino)uracil reductase
MIYIIFTKRCQLKDLFSAEYYFIHMNAAVRNQGSDREFMAQAIDLAWSVKGKTFPNPAVGAIVVAKGLVVGRGATQHAGGDHAEKLAIKKAGMRSRGATLYVTLEPCCHFGRTPPCTEVIIKAGIKRVVVAEGDPNPLVAGKGIAQLKAAGIRIDGGVLGDRAKRINEDFAWAITRRRAWITLKLALTLDGRIADAKGDSQWITGKKARLFAHELRRCHAAVAVGANTLAADNPRLTVRHIKGFAPARILFSSQGTVPEGSCFVKHAKEARSIVVAKGLDERIERDDRTGIEYWYIGKGAPAARLKVFTRMAFETDLTSVLVEGGGQLASAFLEHGLVNRVYLLYGNKLFGNGLAGFRFSRGLPVNRCIGLKNFSAFPLGDTLGITGKPYIIG